MNKNNILSAYNIFLKYSKKDFINFIEYMYSAIKKDNGSLVLNEFAFDKITNNYLIKNRNNEISIIEIFINFVKKMKHINLLKEIVINLYKKINESKPQIIKTKTGEIHINNWIKTYYNADGMLNVLRNNIKELVNGNYSINLKGKNYE